MEQVNIVRRMAVFILSGLDVPLKNRQAALQTRRRMKSCPT